MNTKNTASAPTSDAVRALEASLGGPLTLAMMLRSIREGEGETLDTFAGKLGVSRANLSDIENERRGVSIERAAEWARKLGYVESQFVRLALQAMVDAAKLKFTVSVKKATGSRRAAA